MGANERSLDEARRFVHEVEIDPPRAFRSPARSPPTGPPIEEPGEDEANQAVIVGSQIAEFAAGVPVALRPHISNSFLLAQLAARKVVAKSGGGPGDWFDAYLAVLTSIGWVQEGIATASHKVSGDTLQAQKEVIAVIAAALGPAAASASIVLAALKGLKEISKSSPWLTFFDRQSQTRTVQQFQMAYARADAARMPQISLACFELSATAAVTQVLFFRFSSANAELRHRECQFSLNETFFNALKSDIEKKIAEYLPSLVHTIEI
jgi:hypothetical protein